jgi:hypothetical protein
MMYDIVQFIGSGNEYLIRCYNSSPEVFILVNELPAQTTAMDAEIIECALLSGGARVIGKAKITVEISLI